MTSYADWTATLVADGVLDDSEAETLVQWHKAMRAAIDVDDFTPAEMAAGGAGAPSSAGQAGPGAGGQPASRKTASKKKAASKRKAASKKSAAKKAAAKKTPARSEEHSDT
jgi:hypothetical protein